MSFVLYDLETTGLRKRYDQIIQFAAVQTDAHLNIIDRFETRCRLLPHVIPSPEALCVTGLRIEQLLDSSLPSHFEMVTSMRAVLQRWCPSLFLGFNSLAFDEEFLRHAFYQSLFGAYLTNTQGSARADVLSLCRLAAALRPNILVPARGEDGRAVFKLKALAEANGIAVPGAHEAMTDVITMHRLCLYVMKGAPEIWSQFLRFSHKATVEAFIKDEQAFVVSETVGNQHRTRVITRIGGHGSQANRHYCYDLTVPTDELRRLSDAELAKLCGGANRSIVSIRTNAAPTLWSLDDANDEHLSPLDEAEVLRRAAALRQDGEFIARLNRAAQASEKVYAASPHVEEQLYEGGFPRAQDEAAMGDFHGAQWHERVSLVGRFADDRYRRLAQRLVFFERPDLLDLQVRRGITAEIARRLLSPVSDNAPWLTISAALEEAEQLAAEDRSAAANMQCYSRYLLSRQEELRAGYTAPVRREEALVQMQSAARGAQ